MRTNLSRDQLALVLHPQNGCRRRSCEHPLRDHFLANPIEHANGAPPIFSCEWEGCDCQRFPFGYLMVAEAAS